MRGCRGGDFGWRLNFCRDNEDLTTDTTLPLPWWAVVRIMRWSFLRRLILMVLRLTRGTGRIMLSGALRIGTCLLLWLLMTLLRLMVLCTRKLSRLMALILLILLVDLSVAVLICRLGRFGMVRLLWCRIRAWIVIVVWCVRLRLIVRDIRLEFVLLCIRRMMMLWLRWLHALLGLWLPMLFGRMVVLTVLTVFRFRFRRLMVVCDCLWLCFWLAWL